MLEFLCFLGARYSASFTDSNGDGCNDAVVLSTADKANVLANIENNFAAAQAAGITVVLLADDPAFATSQIVRFSVSSAVPRSTVERIVGAIIGAGAEFIEASSQQRGRALLSREKEWTILLQLNGLLAKLQTDADGDGLENDLDSCPFDAENDGDGDGRCDLAFCFDDLSKVNPQCSDYRPGGRLSGLCEAANVCTICSCACSTECTGASGSGDICPLEAFNDADSDTLCASDDVCPFDAENDIDSDTLCAHTTACVEPEDAVTSFGACADYAEGAQNFGYCVVDGLCDTCPCSCAAECGLPVDQCPHDAENDVDSDSVCAPQDTCPYDAENDGDGDNICGSIDSCPHDVQNDGDGDGICSSVDSCPADASNDADGDLLCASEDSCPGSATGDSDQDGVCDDVDSCPLDERDDVDGDGLCSSEDPCPEDSVNACNETDAGTVVDGSSGGILMLDDETLVIVVAVVCSVRCTVLFTCHINTGMIVVDHILC